MSHPEPDPSASERLTEATRRVVELVRRTTAQGDVAEQALASLVRAAELLEEHAHPGPWVGRRLVFRGFVDRPPPDDLAEFFPYSPLIGPRNPLAPPAHFEIRDGRVFGRVRYGAAYVGPPQSVHGGMIAAMFDELLGSVNIVNAVPGMTASLRVDYRAPTPIAQELRLEGWIDRIEGRKTFTRGTLHHGDTLTAEAEGVFIQGSMQRHAERVHRSREAGPK